MELGLKNKTVLVTASSKGIGRAAAEAFMKENCRVAICSSNKDNLVKTASEIKLALGEEPIWIVCDITKENDIKKTFKIAKDNLGSIDILVNNCGGPPPGRLEEIDFDLWDTAYKEILMSAVRFSKMAIPDMKQKHWGRIINITSIAVKQPESSLVLSNSFRSALTAYTKTLSNEIGQSNITANCVAPGYTLTHRLYELAVDKAKHSGDSHEHILAQMASEVPMRRLARPDEIASMVVFLASEQAGYITGNTIPVDGGFIKSTY